MRKSLGDLFPSLARLTLAKIGNLRKGWSSTELRLKVASWVVLLITPLVVALIWGTYFDDDVYVTFRHARDMVAGGGLTDNLAGEEFPLYTLVLGLSARLRIPLPRAGLLLSALGWGVTTVAIYSTAQAMRRSVVAVVSGMLVAFNPLVVSTLGSGTSWTVAWAWVAVASSVKKRWHIQTVALALILWTRLDWSTLALVVLLWTLQWVRRRRFPLWPGLFLALAVTGWGLMAGWADVALLPSPDPDLTEWGHHIQELVAESEFYWLFLPLMGLGLLATMPKIAGLGLLWGAISALSSGASAEAMLVSLGLFLTGLGIDWTIRWVETHYITRLDRITLTVSLALVAGCFLVIAQASSLLGRYPLRPVVRHKLEQQAGNWLRAHSEPTAVVFGSQRVGYLADRSAFPWDGAESDPVKLANLLRALNEDPPEYCVSFNSIAWDHLMRTDWFQEEYEPLQHFTSPYDAGAPLTVWRYRFGAFEQGERRSLNVHLPGEVDLIGYRYGPDRIQPGDVVYVTLFLRAMQPYPGAFRAVVRVISPHDGVSWAQQDRITSRSDLVGWWQTGQGIAQRFALTTTADIPIGAYQLDMLVTEFDSPTPLPIYQDDDVSPIDRIVLGDVVMPWGSEAQQAALESIKRIDADLGHQINLLGFEAVDSLAPGTELTVTLYWEAQRPPEDDYVVFVHLLDHEGQVVASHDGPPLEGRYRTGTWLPGEVVPDIHHIALDPDVPPGTYRLQVGMYQWPSLERLPIWDSQGTEQTDRVIVLQSIQVQ